MWIVPPTTASDKFTFNIKPVKPFEQGPNIGQTDLTEKALRGLLIKNLPRIHNSPISVDLYVSSARSGSLDMRTLGRFSLSDEAANNLGWIW
jgi:hypothetical protein